MYTYFLLDLLDRAIEADSKRDFSTAKILTEIANEVKNEKNNATPEIGDDYDSR